MKKIICVLIALITLSGSAKVNAMEESWEIRDWCRYMGEEYSISPELLESICFYESSYNPDAVNKYGDCFGLMQVNPKYHKDRIERLMNDYGWLNDLFNPYFNIQVGCDYLAELIEDYGSVEKALMIYHGEKNVNKKYETKKFSSYVTNILAMEQRLKEERGK